MAEYRLSDATRAKFTRISTASIATALFKRGLRNQFIQDVSPVNWKGRNIVGQAFTFRYIPAREDRNGIEVFRNPDHPQRVAVDTCPPGWVLVMDSRKNPRAASAGSILVTRLAIRGCAGVVSDGGFRDADGIGKLDMPAYHQRPTAPTNLTLHEALDINVPISCGDARHRALPRDDRQSQVGLRGVAGQLRTLKLGRRRFGEVGEKPHRIDG